MRRVRGRINIQLVNQSIQGLFYDIQITNPLTNETDTALRYVSKDKHINVGAETPRSLLKTALRAEFERQ